MSFRQGFRIFYILVILLNFTLSDKVISTTTGLISGVDIVTETGTVYSFLGIPYAEPPIGDLRFRKPVAKTPWQNTINATRKPFPCPQNMTGEQFWVPKLENMTEDCLYLNIWVPNASSYNIKKPMTTMVWIYGGAFIYGSSDLDFYDGARLASYGEVIVVSFNFRVGALGFLTALIDDANGNMGMYDQILALQWLKENIANFGGDPEEIILFGQSSGSISISLLLLSPLSKNLFKRAIMESGSFNITIAMDSVNANIKSSNAIARITGCADHKTNITTHPQHVIDCLKSIPVKKITEAEGIFIQTSPITFFPRIGDEFIPYDLKKIMQEFRYKDVELLIGNNDDEGSFFLIVAFPQYFGEFGWNGMEKINKQMAKSLIKATFRFMNEKNVSEIVDYYVRKGKNFKKALYNSVGDYLITCSSVFFADLYSRKNTSTTYYYVFTPKDNNGVIADWLGATHGKEVQFVFGNPFTNMSFTSAYQRMSQRMMDRWLAFAKTGNPNIPGAVYWPPYTQNNSTYLNIDVEEEVKYQPLNERCDFWKDRFKRHYSHLIQD